MKNIMQKNVLSSVSFLILGLLHATAVYASDDEQPGAPAQEEMAPMTDGGIQPMMVAPQQFIPSPPEAVSPASKNETSNPAAEKLMSEIGGLVKDVEDSYREFQEIGRKYAADAKSIAELNRVYTEALTDTRLIKEKEGAVDSLYALDLQNQTLKGYSDKAEIAVQTANSVLEKIKSESDKLIASVSSAGKSSVGTSAGNAPVAPTAAKPGILSRVGNFFSKGKSSSTLAPMPVSPEASSSLAVQSKGVIPPAPNAVPSKEAKAQALGVAQIAQLRAIEKAKNNPPNAVLPLPRAALEPVASPKPAASETPVATPSASRELAKAVEERANLKPTSPVVKSPTSKAGLAGLGLKTPGSAAPVAQKPLALPTPGGVASKAGVGALLPKVNNVPPPPPKPAQPSFAGGHNRAVSSKISELQRKMNQPQ